MLLAALPTTSTNGILLEVGRHQSIILQQQRILLRLIQVNAVPTTMTITAVNTPVTPSFTQVAPVCSGDALAAFTTTSNQMEFLGKLVPSINNTATTTYTFYA